MQKTTIKVCCVCVFGKRLLSELTASSALFQSNGDYILLLIVKFEHASMHCGGEFNPIVKIEKIESSIVWTPPTPHPSIPLFKCNILHYLGIKVKPVDPLPVIDIISCVMLATTRNLKPACGWVHFL